MQIDFMSNFIGLSQQGNILAPFSFWHLTQEKIDSFG